MFRLPFCGILLYQTLICHKYYVMSCTRQSKNSFQLCWRQFFVEKWFSILLSLKLFLLCLLSLHDKMFSIKQAIHRWNALLFYQLFNMLTVWFDPRIYCMKLSKSRWPQLLDFYLLLKKLVSRDKQMLRTERMHH